MPVAITTPITVQKCLLALPIVIRMDSSWLISEVQRKGVVFMTEYESDSEYTVAEFILRQEINGGLTCLLDITVS